LVVVTGLSGAGKSTAVHALEDVGFFCIDNVPAPGVRACLEALARAGVRRVGLGVDVRVRSFLDQTPQVLAELEQTYGSDLRVLFLDASDEALLRRYSSTRRPHPLSMESRAGQQRVATAVLEGIQRERELLSALRGQASIVLDTTELSVHDLRAQVVSRYGPGAEGLPPMHCRFLSFGFKYGPPVDADVILDVRFLKNPFFVPELRALSGLDQPVYDYVMQALDAQGFAEHAEALLNFCVPRFEREGKSYLTVAIGCTGGRHRSVTLVEYLAKKVGTKLELAIDVVHRDVRRQSVAGKDQGDNGRPAKLDQ
jgi:UPF0042 nucleotide-binding protein